MIFFKKKEKLLKIQLKNYKTIKYKKINQNKRLMPLMDIVNHKEILKKYQIYRIKAINIKIKLP